MSWTISARERDPFFSNVSLLLHGNVDGSGDFIDSSPSPKTITKNGDVAPGSSGGGSPVYPSTNPAFGNGIAFDGTGDFLSLGSNAAFAYPSEATIECWIRLNNLSGTQLIYGQATGSSGLVIYVSASGRIGVQTGGAYIESSAVITSNTWHYVAVTKSSSNTYTIFVNGSRPPIVDSFGTMLSSIPQLVLNIGSNSAGSGSFLNGYIDELRITKGVERQIYLPASPFPDF
jgi:hypothetical protein